MARLRNMIDPEPSEYRGPWTLWFLILPVAITASLVELRDPYGFGSIAPLLLAIGVLLRLLGDLLAMRNRGVAGILRYVAALTAFMFLVVAIADGIYAWNGNNWPFQ